MEALASLKSLEEFEIEARRTWAEVLMASGATHALWRARGE